MKTQLLTIFSAILFTSSYASAQTLQSLQDDIKQLQRVVAVQQAMLTTRTGEINTLPSIDVAIANGGRNDLNGPALSIPAAGEYLVFLNAQTYSSGCERPDQTTLWLLSDQGQERITSITGNINHAHQTAGNVSLITRFNFTKPGKIKIQYQNWRSTPQTPCKFTLGDLNLGYMRLN